LHQSTDRDAQRDDLVRRFIDRWAPSCEGYRLLFSHRVADNLPVVRLFVIDLAGLDEATAREKYPAAYQRVYVTGRPRRMQNRDAGRTSRWWLFGRSNEHLRSSPKGLSR
jgi:hypothetical protein